MMKRPVLSYSLLFLALLAVGMKTPPQVDLDVQVVDEEGAAIADAEVNVHAVLELFGCPLNDAFSACLRLRATWELDFVLTGANRPELDLLLVNFLLYDAVHVACRQINVLGVH